MGFKFGLSSDRDVLAASVVEVTKSCLRPEKGSPYDPRFGPPLGSEDPCVVCDAYAADCPGHFGHICLATPVVLFYREATAFAKRFCHGCGALLARAPDKAFPPPYAVCERCGFQQPLVKLQNASCPATVEVVAKPKRGCFKTLSPDDLKVVFDKISDDDVRAYGADPRHFHPNRLVMTVFPVLPTCCRPKTQQGDDDLTVFLSQIVKINARLKTFANDPTSPEAQALAQALKLKTLCFFDNSKGKAVQNINHKPMTGIKERLSKKTGILRQNMMGKRRDQTARSVVGPDGTLELDQVAIPPEIAANLTILELVTPFNIAFLQHLVDRGLATEHDRPLVVGDRVDRFLRDDDVVILNRQPTLHRNSMLGMKVKIRPGKTIRLNLAVTPGFNMDFDGDEGNVYLPRGYEARAEALELMSPKRLLLSNRSETVEIFPVQDTMLGAYLMTRKDAPVLSKDVFFQCVEAIAERTSFERVATVPDYGSRRLVELLLPLDFTYESPDLCVRDGRIVRGVLVKNVLKNGRSSLVRKLCLEAGEDVAARFIDGLQFVTKAWLEHRPFSVGYQDCLSVDLNATRVRVEEAVRRGFFEASRAVVDRERETCLALENARNAALKAAKDGLSPDNRLALMVRAGSKGDWFNLTQITGLLGQQYVEGERPAYDVDGGQRSLPHYLRAGGTPGDRYESRGFVRSSFLKGLNPRELFFHAKSGREGMINTSQTTGVTGYAERRMVKLNEDLVTAYDGSVRDARQNIVQHVYANHGLNPQRCWKDGTPLDFEALATSLKAQFPASLRLEPAVTDGQDALPFQGQFPKLPNAPEPIRRRVWSFHERTVREGAKRWPVPFEAKEAWIERVRDTYLRAEMCPGEAVGVTCSQAIGAKQTQKTLDTFHHAGLLVETGYRRFGEILNLTQRPKRRTCVLKLRISPSTTASDIRDALGCSLVEKTFKELCPGRPPKPERRGDETILSFHFCAETAFAFRVGPPDAAAALRSRFEPPHFEVEPFDLGVRVGWRGVCDVESVVADAYKVKIGGAPGVKRYVLKRKDDEWYAVAEGSCLKKFLAHPLVDPAGSCSDDLWDVYRTLGLTAVKKRLKELTTACVGNDVHPAHVRLLIDRMTRTGKPTALDRYTMRTCDVGPLSRAAFEESLDILIGSAVSSEYERCDGVGARIIAGKRARCGTGFFDIVLKPPSPL